MFKKIRDHISGSKPSEYKGKDIAEFKGSILGIGGTQGELKRISARYSDYFAQEKRPLSDLIYTVNISKSEGADMLADAGSIKNMASLPDKRFDIVYFGGISNDVHFLNALQTTARVLKEDGVLILATPGCAINEKLNPTIKRIDACDNSEKLFTDFKTIFEKVGLTQYVEIPEPLKFDPNTKTWTRECNGGYWIASKSFDLDLKKKCETHPLLNAIIADNFSLNPDSIVGYFNDKKRSKPELEKNHQGPSLKKR